MVYSGGLRRCLIIFAPHTLILDRRTCTCRAPSLQLVLQRSKYFTTGAAVPFNTSSPIMAERHSQPTQASIRPVGHTGVCSHLARLAMERPLHQVPLNEHQGQHNSTGHIRSMLCHSMDEHPARTGCLRHTEFSTVTAMVDPGCGLGTCRAQRL